MGTCWATGCWATDSWATGSWGSGSSAAPFDDGLYFLIPMAGGVFYIKKL